MPEPTPLPISDQLAAVAREVALRKNVYPKRVAAGRMKPEEARRELDAMLAVGRTLQAVRDATPQLEALLQAGGHQVVDGTNAA